MIKKHSEIADIMEDNNRVLSLISAYYMGKRWTFNEEVQNLVTQIFTEMYVIEYNFDSETKKSRLKPFKFRKMNCPLSPGQLHCFEYIQRYMQRIYNRKCNYRYVKLQYY